MSWKRDLRSENARRVGGFTIFSEVDEHRETAHVVQFPDGREYRVLPNGQGGRVRSVQVRAAVESLESVSGSVGEPEALLVYFRGLLSEYGLPFQEIGDESSIDVWLARWFESENLLPTRAGVLLDDLADAGWQIERTV